MGVFERGMRRDLDEDGRDIEHHYFTKTESDGREVWTDHADSPDTITAIPGQTSQGLGFQRDERSAQVRSMRPYYVSDEVSNLEDGGDSGASEFVDDGTRYTVMDVDDLGGGLLRCICWRED